MCKENVNIFLKNGKKKKKKKLSLVLLRKPMYPKLLKRKGSLFALSTVRISLIRKLGSLNRFMS